MTQSTRDIVAATPSTADGDDHSPPDLARTVGRTGLLLGGRRVIVMVLSAVTTAVIARVLGVSAFGSYAAGITTVQLIGGLADFGFSLMLGRDLVTESTSRGALTRAAVRMQSLWAIVLAFALALVALLTGLDETRAQVILVLSPFVALSGLGAFRQIFLVMFRVRALALVDLTTNIVAAIVTISVAVLTGNAVYTAIAFCVGAAANPVLVALLGYRHLDRARPDRQVYRAALRRALPLGAASILTSMYFMIDLVLLGWLVEPAELGEYAAAVKFLTILVALPGLIMSTALPGLSIVIGDRRQLSDLTARVSQWLAMLGVPLCVGVAVFAEPLVRLFFGEAYAGAVPLARILAVSAGVSALSSAMGMLLVALSLTRAQVLLSAGSLVFNIALNLALVPEYGVAASAWITLATEVLASGGCWWLVRHHVDMHTVLGRLWRPAAATTVLATVGLALSSVPLIAIPTAAAAFVGTSWLMRAWPEEFVPRRWMPVRG